MSAHFGTQSENSKLGRFLDGATVAADTQFILGVDRIDFASIHLNVAAGGSLVAAVKIYLSDSYQPNPSNIQDETLAIVPGNWVEITSECVGIVAITGAGVQNQIVIPQRTGTAGRIQASALRIVIVRASGSGTVSGWYFGRSGA